MSNITLKRWRTLCYIQAVLSLEAFLAPVLIMFYTSYAGFTFEQYSAIIALIFVFLWMLEIPAGALADKYGRKRALIAGNGVYLSAMICLVMQSHSVPGWLIALLFAFGGSLSSSTFQSMPVFFASRVFFDRSSRSRRNFFKQRTVRRDCHCCVGFFPPACRLQFLSTVAAGLGCGLCSNGMAVCRFCMSFFARCLCV